MPFSRTTQTLRTNKLLKCKTAMALTMVLFAIGVTAAADDCPPRPRGWFVRICRQNTDAPGVRLEIGVGGNSGTHRYWREWTHAMSETELALPTDLVYAKEIWIKGTAYEEKDVHMCTYFNDHSTQKMTFDEDEEHETSRDDNDNCDC